MRRWLALAFFTLLISMSFAISPDLNLTMAVPIVAVISTILIGMMIMLSSAIANPQLEAWAKNELREQIAAVILIVIIISVFVASNAFVGTLSGVGNAADAVNAAKNIIDRWLNAYDTAAVYIIGAMTKIRVAASYAPNVNIALLVASLNYSSNPLGGIGILLGPLGTGMQSITNMVFLLEGLRVLLVFLKATVPPILLPLAFIARLIPFTRKLGNTLIALCLAGILLLPFSVIFADFLNSSIGTADFPKPHISSSDMDKLDANPAPMVLGETLCGTVPLRLMFSITEYGFAAIVCLPALLFPAAYPACFTLVSNVVYPLINEVFQIAFSALVAVWEIATALGGQDLQYGREAFDVLRFFMKDVGNLVLIGYLDFVIIATITIAGARSISAALGGEWYMAGIQRLI